jgi:Tfp pilus assembly protein PilO
MTNPRLRRGSWLVTSALAGGGLLYLFCSFLPNARAIHALHDEIRSRQQFGSQAPSVMATAIATQKQLDHSKAFIADSKHQLPGPTQMPELSGQIARQTDLAGARTTHFQPLPSKAMSGLQLVPMELNVDGTFDQVDRLLARIESLPERIWVDDIKITREREDGKDEQCAIKLSVFAENSDKSN